MLSVSKYQRIKHLQLQGFTVEQAAIMQGVKVNEVFEVYKSDVTGVRQDSIDIGDAPFKDRIKMNK